VSHRARPASDDALNAENGHAVLSGFDSFDLEDERAPVAPQPVEALG
jgi:hypothetical protein